MLQKNSVVGDFDKNFEVIKNAYKKACLKDCDFLLTSELFLTGYPPQDLISRLDFQEKVNFFRSLITSLNYLIWGDV